MLDEMSRRTGTVHRPKLGIQGPVVAWQDPWAGEASDRIMRTGTGSLCPSQDPKPDPSDYMNMLTEMNAEFYVHHEVPGADDSQLLDDMVKAGMDLVFGNEYGNINGPWTEGTNRYDLPDHKIIQAVQSGRCIGLLYDEPEHLQINAGQYRRDGWYPHWAPTDGHSLVQSRSLVEQAAAARVRQVDGLGSHSGMPPSPKSLPLISEQVFPVLFHTLARAGMDLCPKIMKESFQPLQLGTAIGAAKQYGRALWICADLWGPDVGSWFTRFPGFPGHSPEEFESALKLGYWMGPSHLFVENIDVLLRHSSAGFSKTEYGEIWEEFTGKFIAEHPLTWDHTEADPDIVIIHSDDSNYGQNARLFGNRNLNGGDYSQSVFHIWHLISRGTIPSHGSCMHIPGFDFPRDELKRRLPLERFPLEHGFQLNSAKPTHPLFYPVNNAVVYDDQVSGDQLGQPRLIMVGGSSLSLQTLSAVRNKAEEGATVIIGRWLVPPESPGLWRESGKAGAGRWVVTDHFLDEAAREAAEPFLGEESCWVQRFGKAEVRIYKRDNEGFVLDFDVICPD